MPSPSSDPGPPRNVSHISAQRTAPVEPRHDAVDPLPARLDPPLDGLESRGECPHRAAPGGLARPNHVDAAGPVDRDAPTEVHSPAISSSRTTQEGVPEEHRLDLQRSRSVTPLASAAACFALRSGSGWCEEARDQDEETTSPPEMHWHGDLPFLALTRYARGGRFERFYLLRPASWRDAKE